MCSFGLWVEFICLLTGRDFVVIDPVPGYSHWFTRRHCPFVGFLSAAWITAWWNTLNRTGEVGQPSRKPRWGIQWSLSPSFPFTTYAAVSWRSIKQFRKVPLIPCLLRISHNAGFDARGYAFSRSRRRPTVSLGRCVGISSAVLLLLMKLMSSCTQEDVSSKTGSPSSSSQLSLSSDKYSIYCGWGLSSKEAPPGHIPISPLIFH